jgi:hypothetical protein
MRSETREVPLARESLFAQVYEQKKTLQAEGLRLGKATIICPTGTV